MPSYWDAWSLQLDVGPGGLYWMIRKALGALAADPPAGLGEHPIV